MTCKPGSDTDLAPCLVGPDPDAVPRSCEKVFGAEGLRVISEGDRIRLAGCRIGDTVRMMGGAEGGGSALLHLCLPDPDAAFDRALAAGATPPLPMSDKGDGDRRGGVQSPCVTQWHVARQVRSVSS